jgi:hypothetical protein
MVKKAPGTSVKPWAPGDPLKLDKAFRPNGPAGGMVDKLDRADEMLRSHVNNVNHSTKPISQKSFNRQKKG